MLVASLAWLGLAKCDAIHQDSRCNCICPDPLLSQAASISKTDVNENNFSDSRTIYINSTVSPDDCNCVTVVLIHLNLTDAQSDSFCPRCKCKYQTRSLTVIKVVVILVVWVISLLLFYMAFLSILEPILSKKRAIGLPGANIGYNEHHDTAESDDGSGIPTNTDSTQMRSYSGAEGIINRMGTQQSKWKRQVQEQRRNIYDRHAMLN
jgi:hypothetical protein